LFANDGLQQEIAFLLGQGPEWELLESPLLTHFDCQSHQDMHIYIIYSFYCNTALYITSVCMGSCGILLCNVGMGIAL
jgi:hypothetical protein